MAQNETINRLPVNEEFARPATAAAFDRAVAGLRERGIDVQIVADGAAARELLLTLVPEGVEVGEGASETLDGIGVTEVIEKSGRYDAIRPRTRSMDRATQMREIRKLGAAPDAQINSVHAITEDGRLVIASSTGSQLGPLGFGAGRVILVAGAQKIVPDLATAFRRIEEYCLPREDAKMMAAYGRHSGINKMLILNKEIAPGRITAILVREPVGI